MSKITNYEYNRTDNSITVNYESGTTRKYSVNNTPETVKLFICEDVVYGNITSLIEKYETERDSLMPAYRNTSICSDEHHEISEKLRVCVSKIQLLENFNSCALSQILGDVRLDYFCSKFYMESKDERNDRVRHLFKAENDVIIELSQMLDFQIEDVSFELTFSHILNIIADSESNSETEEVVSKQPESESESEVKECRYCRECIHYEQCSVYAPEKMECRTVNRLLCGSVVCCEDFVSRDYSDFPPLSEL